MLEKVTHRLTAYHWRSDRRSTGTVLGICSCGWRARFMRPSMTTRLRRVVCLFRGHRWDDPEPIMVGPAGAPDDQFESIGDLTMCDYCWASK